MVRNPAILWPLFGALWSDVGADESFFSKRPLLAHYTTMGALEKIVVNNEIWFSNPLFMNDIEEVRFGINEGTNALLQSDTIRKATGDNYPAFETALLAEHSRFDGQHAFDTYILCLSEHDEADDDGLLSMWRGYGDGGKGIAVVFDARTITEVKNTPLIVSRVVYATTQERFDWFDRLAQNFSQIVVQQNIQKEEMPVAANALFARLRMFSLFTKHKGFSEEREWRLAYLPERDVEGRLREHLSYFNGPRGVEPKLKLPIAPMPEFGNNQPFTLETIVHKLILGPTVSSVLSVESTKRMLETLKRPALAQRVIASRIPYRAF